MAKQRLKSKIQLNKQTAEKSFLAPKFKFNSFHQKLNQNVNTQLTLMVKCKQTADK